MLSIEPDHTLYIQQMMNVEYNRFEAFVGCFEDAVCSHTHYRSSS